MSLLACPGIDSTCLCL